MQNNIIEAIPLSQIQSFISSIKPDEEWMKILANEGFRLEWVRCENNHYFYKFIKCYTKEGLKYAE